MINPRTLMNVKKLTGVSLLAGLLLSSAIAQAEGTLRVAQQFGITYLLLDVAREQQLIEKHGKEEGIDIDVEWRQISGAAAMNEALLAGALDVVTAGRSEERRVGKMCRGWGGGDHVD